MKRKKLISKITERHPGMWTSTGFSYYVGGMKDTGGWYVDKLEAASKPELLQLLAKMIFEEAREPYEMTDEENLLASQPVIIADRIHSNMLEMKNWKGMMDDFNNKMLFGK